MAKSESDNRNLRSNTVKQGREKGYFPKGNKGKPKGAVSEKTKFWNELSDFVTGKGAEKFKQELFTLEGKEFIDAYSKIIEFFKPKLGRQEIQAEVTDLTIKVEREVVRKTL